jgi:Cytochrome bd terminal oxidase subunit I
METCFYGRLEPHQNRPLRQSLRPMPNFTFGGPIGLMQPKVNGNAWINATRTGTLPVRLYDFAPHYLSAITIGLASYLVVLESLWLWRGNHVYRQLHHYRSTIFGVNPAMRGVSGLAGAYQFGTNWSYLSGFAGRVLRSNQQVFTDA